MNHDYTGFNDDIMMLDVIPALDDEAAQDAAWAEYCAANGYDDDHEEF